MASPAAIAIPLIFAGWAIWLAGVANQEAKCTDDVNGVLGSGYPWIGVTGGRALLASKVERCGYPLGLEWYILFQNFFNMLLAAGVVFSPAVAKYRMGVLALFAVNTAIMIISANTSVYTAWAWDEAGGVPNSWLSAVRVHAAGIIITIIGNMLFMLLGSAAEEDAPATAGKDATQA
mmetsp:Transcript_5440/g.13433  ORF Transcript_5440/g.13433 Transcript_5440/m.13433 type:complete len:177 (-) Transcript_5440:374-904(-)|eukprot:CAMPEP_0202877014 /NCGR_PEP_ID=MMETSP1391-20130828/29940_1 /ASSEMBLY_ACC=CAM_ASM_000867 /TAXON_ID=1034604 /ORGANISM="Chlamydomonas leiostraca, Strain SAG 11-49" /LENGTH=176 /DNA_ID=CAMNT_0049558959 /DNA_START=97 /DNA_END=627 /DNA_ORIENTATION=+